LVYVVLDGTTLEFDEVVFEGLVVFLGTTLEFDEVVFEGLVVF